MMWGAGPAFMYVMGLAYACIRAFEALPLRLRRSVCSLWYGPCFERVISCDSPSLWFGSSDRRSRDAAGGNGNNKDVVDEHDVRRNNLRLVLALSQYFDECDPGWSERCTQGRLALCIRNHTGPPGPRFILNDFPEHFTAIAVERNTVYVSVDAGTEVTMRLRVWGAGGGAFIARLCRTAEQTYERRLREEAAPHTRYLYIPQPSAYCNSIGIRELLVQRVPLSRRTSLDNLCHPEVPRIRRALRSFVSENNSRKKSLILPNKLGIFAYGVPGSGKTTLAKAVANELDRDIILVDLNVIRNPTELGYLFGNGVFRVSNASQQAVEYASIEYDKVVILLDDLDCSVDISGEKHPVAEDGHSPGSGHSPGTVVPRLSLKHVLHEMDGIKDTPGRVIVATANAVEGIDIALRRRGRFDLWLKFDYADLHMAMRKIELVFGDPVTEVLQRSVAAWLARDHRRTLADVESICKEVHGDVQALPAAFDADVAFES